MKKTDSGAGPSLSDRKQNFGEKAKGCSSIGSYRKKKLHGAAAHGLKEGVESSRYLQKEDGPEEQNVAEEVLESSKRTGEKVTGSAGKAIQKRQIKKKMVTSAHQKRVKGSGTMGRFLNGVENAVGKAGEDLAKAVAEHPIPVVGALVLGILILVVVVSLSSCSLLIGSFHGSAVTTSYTAQDVEILAADAYYGDLEEKLADQVDQIETDHPGYDEYRYDVDAISHDPYELASLLTVLYEEYTAGEVTGALHGIFDAQYGIVLTETEETRTKLETKTRWEKKSRIEEREGVRLKWDEVNKKFILETYTYEVEVEYWEEVEYEEEVPYQYDVLHIFLTNRSVDTVVRELGLTEEQLQRYELLRVLEAKRTAPNSRARSRCSPISVERIRVAAYVRVSTDDDEQLGSFESQKKYYEEKIAENLEWVNAGIFADEAITGTLTNKRTGFQEMINKCMNGDIDLILTKSISRFARNTLDTLQYSRMLRDKNIGILFEKENIYTLDMQGEMLLTIMSSLAQQEVESLSKNVKMGLKMKMKRGEMIGFNGCLGYDYHPEDKSISVNEEEAVIIRFIYDMYLQGYGSNTIAKHLTQMGKRNKKGEVSWLGHGIMGIIKNEKYKGDLLLGKTFTLDPINKRRLANMGEEDQFYIKDHHEPIVTREVWEAAQRIREKRTENRVVASTGYRERFTRQYAFSSMCECGFCGHKLSRRTRHCSSVYEKPIWHCMNATKYGIKNCPNCKAIDEAILEGTFVDMFKLLAGSYDDVLDVVMATVEETASNPEDMRKKQQIDKDISVIESKKSRMTDMLIDGTISKEAYNEKIIDFSRKLNALTEKKMLLEESINKQRSIGKRMTALRNTLSNNQVLDEFDRVVFESIVEKVIVGGLDEKGTPDPYKLTFVLKSQGEEIIPHAKEFYKQKQKEIKAKKKGNNKVS